MGLPLLILVIAFVNVYWAIQKWQTRINGRGGLYRILMMNIGQFIPSHAPHRQKKK